MNSQRTAERTDGRLTVSQTRFATGALQGGLCINHSAYKESEGCRREEPPKASLMQLKKVSKWLWIKWVDSWCSMLLGHKTLGSSLKMCHVGPHGV